MKKFLKILFSIVIPLVGFYNSHAQFQVSGRLCAPDLSCKTDSTIFADTLSTPVATAWQWNFGDVASGPANGSSLKKATHLYRAQGMYNVTLIRTSAGRSDTLRKAITIGDVPPMFQKWPHKPEPPDTVVCLGEKIKLDPYPLLGPSGAKYLWYPKGDTTKAITVDSSGCYSVQVTLPNGCSYEDRVVVKVCGEDPPPPASKFFFGTNAGLDFSFGTPIPIVTPPSNINTMEGSSSAIDSKGKLQFYTDGVRIYDREGNLMASKNKDTTLLAGSSNATQSVAIVGKPVCKQCEYLYYVFTTSDINGKKQLSYSVVDMRRNGGKGEIVEKNVPLHTPTTERLVAIKTDTTYWVISHDLGSNVFRIFHATTAGLVPSTYAGGLAHTTNAQGEGYMKMSGADSNQVRKLAVVIPGPPRNTLQLFDFVDSTGRLSNPRTIDLGPAPPKAYGVEFSPDNTKLYVSYSGNGTAAVPSELWQYDISLGDSSRIADSKIKIDSSNTQIYGALQLGPDRKIYLAVKGATFLGVINAPNEDSQQEVNFRINGQTLNNKVSQLGLPNLRRDEVMPDNMGFTLEYADTCSTKPTQFMATPQCDPLKNTYNWNFGDGTPAVSSSRPETSHTYAKEGTYTVTLRQQILTTSGGVCKDTTITKTLTIIKTPDPIKLRNPVDTCVNVLNLDAGVVAERYIWTRNGSPIARTRTLALTNAQSGTYVVTAANGRAGECFQRGQTVVTLRRPPAVNLGRDTSVCTATTAGITLAVAETTWRTFKWSTGATTRDIKITQPGKYSVVVVNGNQCTNQDTVEVKALPKAQIAATTRPPTGCTTRDGAITVTSVNPAGNYQYAWYNANNIQQNSTTRTLNNVLQGKYRVQISGTPQTCATDSVITLSANNSIVLDTTVVPARCTQPTAGTISVTITQPAVSTPTFVWTNTAGMTIGRNAPIITGLSPGKYNVRVTDATSGCETEMRDITVRMFQERFVQLGPDRKKCIGDTVWLDPRVAAIAGNVFAWNTGEATPRIVVKQPGNYTLTVNNAITGCKDSDNVVIDFTPRPSYDLTRDMPVCEPDGGSATLVVTPKTPNLSYFWPHSSEITPKIKVNKKGNYLVRIIAPEGCVVQDTAKVFVACEPRVYVPDAFSPNNDRVNDDLKITGDHYTNFELWVFNRWGEVVFHTLDINEKWNGSYRNTFYPPMVYPYVVTFGSKYYPLRPRKTQRGAILLVR